MLTERYRERLAGVLSCYDRIIVTGTLPGVCYAKGMTAFSVEADMLEPILDASGALGSFRMS